MPSSTTKRPSLRHPHHLGVLTALLAALAWTHFAWAQPPMAQEIGGVEIHGDLGKDESINISGLDGAGDLLLMVADEGEDCRVLKRNGERSYAALDKIDLDAGGEVDLEAAAWGGQYVYILGSHSRKRKTVKDDKTAAQNRERLYTTETEPTRDHLYRLELGEDGALLAAKSVSLRGIFDGDTLLESFQIIPSKENGIDLEGLAVDGEERLFVGFRGPVLRENYVPILVLKTGSSFEQQDLSYEILFVNLGGWGIRGMESTGDGFLILAGPVGDGPASYRLYFWDGQSCVPGKDAPNALEHVRAICEIPAPTFEGDQTKAEAIHLIEESAEEYRFLIAYDSAPRGAITEFSCARP